jgi:hypothetical protein
MDPPGDNPNDTRLAVPVPNLELFRPQTADVIDVPRLLKLREVKPDDLRGLFRASTPYHLELICPRETNEGYRRLEGVLREHGFSLIVDAAAQNRLDKPRLKTNYALYFEDVTPDELVRLLEHLGQADRQAEAKKKGDGRFDSLVVLPMTTDDRKELSGLLGIDPTQVQPDRTPDPRTDIRESTVKDLPGGRQALVVSYNPVRPRPGSPDIKRFLEGRKVPRPGTVQVLVVLREPGAG